MQKIARHSNNYKQSKYSNQKYIATNPSQALSPATRLINTSAVTARCKGRPQEAERIWSGWLDIHLASAYHSLSNEKSTKNVVFFGKIWDSRPLNGGCSIAMFHYQRVSGTPSQR